jgi:DNA-binding LacI/PurR family transcriptional regulator
MYNALNELKRNPTISDVESGAWAKQGPLGEALLAMALDLGPNARMPTVRTLCARYGVSTSTLDPVLRSLELRGAIVRQHGRGIFVAPTIRHKTVGVVFGGDIFSASFSPFWSLLLQAVREQAGERELEPRAYLDISRGHDGLGGHAQLLEDLEERRLDGLLLLTPSYQDDEAGRLRRHGTPLVVFGGMRNDNWRVTHHPVTLYRLAARKLAARGCRTVALLGPDVWARRPLIETELRAAGAKAAQIVDWSFETWEASLPGTLTREKTGYELVRRMIAARAETCLRAGLKQAPLPDGLLTTDDTVTRGAIAALQQAGLQPGRDLHIATGSNKGSPVLDPYADDLIRIEYDPAESVRAALDMLTVLMDGGTPTINPVLIEPKCVERTSSPQPPARGRETSNARRKR